jgi:hypothetical protein
LDQSEMRSHSNVEINIFRGCKQSEKAFLVLHCLLTFFFLP